MTRAESCCSTMRRLRDLGPKRCLAGRRFWFVVLLSVLVHPSVPAPAIVQASPIAASCSGDCDGNWYIDVAELIVAISIALGDRGVGACGSLDADRDEQVGIGELLAAVHYSLQGCGEQTTPTPTPTSTPTVTATPTLSVDASARAVMAEVADALCWDSFHVTETTAYCEHRIGHYGNVTLTGFADEQDAREEFGGKAEGEEEAAFLGGQLRIDSRPNPCCPSTGGLIQHWRWLKGCWIISGYAFDDTSYLLAPQPRQSIETIAAAGDRYALFSRCPDQP